VRFVCELCGRRGQYRKRTLIDRYGPDIVGPDLLVKVADCPRRKSLGDRCGVVYQDLLPLGRRKLSTVCFFLIAYGTNVPGSAFQRRSGRTREGPIMSQTNWYILIAAVAIIVVGGAWYYYGGDMTTGTITKSPTQQQQTPAKK
jgi:hypothetical protein